MRFKKLRVTVGVSLVIFVLFVSIVIGLGFTKTGEPIQQIQTVEEIKKTVVPEKTVVQPEQVVSEPVSQVVSQPEQVVAPEPVQAPIIVHRTVRTRAS